MCFLKLILLFVFAKSAFGVGQKRHINDYLLDLKDFTRKELENYNAFSDGVQRVIEFHDWKTVNLSEKYNSAHVFNLGNENYVLLNQDIFYLLPQAHGLQLTPPKFTFSKFDDEIKFIKTINNLDFGIMLVAHNHGIAKIYGYGNNTDGQLLFLQTIKSPNNFMDAQFFWNKGKLHLVISSQVGVAQAPTTVYKWVESHFDEVDKIFVAAASSLATFSYLDSEIIVLLRNYQVGKTHSYVYEFNSGKLKKIQILNTQKPTQLRSFVDANKQYLVIFDEEGLSVLYLWDGDELVPFQKFDSFEGIYNALEINEGKVSLIFGANKQKIYAFASTFSNIELSAIFKFHPKYAEISGFHVIKHNNTNKIFTIGSSEDSKVIYTLVSYKINELEIVSNLRDSDQLSECLNDLESSLQSNDHAINNLSNLSKNKLKVDAPQELKGRLNIAAPVLAETASLMLDNDQDEEEIKRIEDTIEALEGKISLIEDLLPKDPFNEKVFFGKVIVQGEILGDNLNSANIIIKKLNGINWAPNQWLSYSKDQVIIGNFTISELNVDELYVDESVNQATLSNFLLLNGSQTISATARLKTLNSTNISAKEINGIALDKVYLRDQPTKISGVKTVTSLNVKNVQTNLLNGKNASETIKLFGDPKGFIYNFASQVKIKNLNVETINGVNWNDFANSVFRIGKTKSIKGNLRIPEVKTNNLVTKYISGIKAEDLLTTTTDQVVNSTIHFENINSEVAYCDSINDLDFAKDVVTYGENKTTAINGPVVINNVKVNGTLFLNESPANFSKRKGVFGKNASDLLQIYNQKVKIIGDVYLKNLYLPNPAKVFIDGNEFNQDEFNNYWLKNTNQMIPVHFTALEGITTPHINTGVLNNHPVNSYMINNLDDKPRTRLAFSNLTVLGNIIINENLPHVPNLQDLDRKSVKLNGTFVLKGRKEFMGSLTVDNLKADVINEVSIRDIPTRTSSEISGSKTFDKIIVEGDVNSNSLNINRINDIDLRQLEEETIYINKPTNIEKLDFASVKVNNFFTTKINNRLFNEYILSLDEIYLMDKLKVLKVKTNATINNVNNLKFINDVDMGNKINADPITNSFVNFEGNVFAKNLIVSMINDINFQKLLPRLYYRHWPQNITARHSFRVLKSANILTASINDKNVENIIDISTEKPQLLILDDGLRIENARFEQSLNAENIECSLEKALEALSNIPTRVWNYVKVEGNATILDDKSNLITLLKNAVHANRTNVIRAPVIFDHISAQNINAKKNINGIDLNEIINDALLLNSDEQIVSGFIEFSSLKISSAAVLGNADLPFINGVDMLALNKSIIHKDNIYNSPIKGHKTFFFGLETNNFEANTISGILPENLVSLENPLPIPSAKFNTLEVLNDMNVTFINNKNFEEFLNDRILANSEKEQVVTGVNYFDELVLKGNSIVPTLNTLDLSDVVFDEGVQVINSQKKFNRDINIFGNANINELNGVSIDALYKNSIKFNEVAEIDGNVQFNEVTEIKGNLQVQKINGIPVESIKDMLISNVPEVRAHIVKDLIRNITDVLDENKRYLQDLPNEYLYLEKSDRFQILTPHAISAQIINHKEDIIVHIQTEEQGGVCFLPQRCPCPGQNSVQILPGYAINEFSKKMFQRVFSFEIPEMVIHVVTNTISTNSTCRLQNTTLPETTKVNWITSPTTNSSGGFYSLPEEFPGYVSDVKFFIFDGQAYVIMARYYDPQGNTHEVETLVLRFAKDNAVVEEIQRIRTIGAWNLHVFSSAQGVHLIIGARGVQDDYTTGIYRFNETSRQFEVLRYVSIHNCLSSTSIVLDYESFIILASENAPMQILKYDYEYNNYLYQTNIFVENVVSVSSFTIEGGNDEDAFLAAVSNTGKFYIYSYKYLAGWRLLSKGQIKELRSLVPFNFQERSYIFAASKAESSVLKVVQYGLT